ncbi:MAG: flippase, partial [Candidatus Muiribacteriota bacterium]
MKKTISIKQNFFINSIVNILNIIVPIITLPYLSRTLGPENLGKINFAISYTDYFSKLALLGIPKYALREISQNRDNQLILNKTFSEIILIKIITSLISFLLFFLSIIFIPKLNNEIRIFLPLSFSILFSFLSLEWFYGGFENFKFLTKRAVVLKLSAIILILTLIKKPADYYLYGFIVLFGIVSGNFAHIFFALKKVRFSLININLKKHFKPVIYLSGTFLATGLYMNIDKVMIGFLSSNENIAFYYIPNKLCMILLALLMSLSGVLIPRFSYYIKNKKFDEYKIILKKSINFIFFLSIPSMIGIFLLSEQIISLFASSEFSEAIITLKIMVLIIITTAL